MNSSHHATFNLCSSASPVLQMFYGVSTVGLSHYKIAMTKSFADDAKQPALWHRAPPYSASLLDANRRSEHLGYFVNGPRRPKPASERRDAAPMIKGSIGKHS